MHPTPKQIVDFIQSKRFSLSGEKSLQVAMATEFEKAGFVFHREVRLAPGDIIDFLFEGGIGLEVKIKGGKMDIYSQCVRYCASDRVGALILATNVAMGFPPSIAGKPAYMASLGKAWL